MSDKARAAQIKSFHYQNCSEPNLNEKKASCAAFIFYSLVYAFCSVLSIHNWRKLTDFMWIMRVKIDFLVFERIYRDKNGIFETSVLALAIFKNF